MSTVKESIQNKSSIHNEDLFDSQQQVGQRILIADDDIFLRQLLQTTLSRSGFEVLCAVDGYDMVRLAQERVPDLILVDLMMPHMDGFEAIRQLRSDTRTGHIPMIVLTALSRSEDLVTGFETGADDYIIKPFDVVELVARIRSHLRRAARRPALNALSGLPGSVLFAQELNHRLLQHEPVALLYADLDHFKAFNDTYGFARGDQAILLVAALLREIAAAHPDLNDFTGHIGGDDFALLTSPTRVDSICRSIIAKFDREVRLLYDVNDRRRGYLSGADRYGILRRFNMMTISIGVVTTNWRSFGDIEEFTRVAAEMKNYAKTQSGSSYAIDQRGVQLPPKVERRGSRRRNILVVSDDTSLRTTLRTALQAEGFAILEASGVEGLRQQMKAKHRPSLAIVDAQLGDELWSFCREQTGAKTPIIALAYDDQEVEQAYASGIAACLQQPMPLVDLVACVDQQLTPRPKS